MSKLQKAINHLSKRHVENGTPDYYILAEALEEVRDHQDILIRRVNKLTEWQHKMIEELYLEELEKEEQPTTFEPWHDVVQIVGPTSFGDNYFLGHEGFVSGDDEGNGYKVTIGEESNYTHFPHESLRLVYRLKPRAQAEHIEERIPGPKFKMDEYVQDERDLRIYQVVADSYGPCVQVRDCADNSICALEEIWLCTINPPVQPDPPIFKAGEYVQTSGSATGHIEMVAPNNPQRWWVLLDNGSKVLYDASELTRIDKPTPTNEDLLRAAGYTQKPASVQVGDWVRDTRDGRTFQIEGIEGDYAGGRDPENDNRHILRSIPNLEKTDPPAPRFTFGDRVTYDSGDYIFRYVCPDGEDMAYIYDDEDKLVRSVSKSALTNVDEIPF